MLAARGVAESPIAMAGAMLEGERDAMVVAYIKAYAKASEQHGDGDEGEW